MSKLAAALIGALALAAGVAAQQPEAWGIDALMRSLAAVKSSKGAFVERKYMGVLTEPLELTGTLSYTAPERLEKRTLAPEPAAMVVDGDRLTIEAGPGSEPRTLVLRDHPAVWAFVESIRGTLSGDLALLERFYEVRLEGSRDDWRLLLTPREPGMRELVREIRLAGGGRRITSVEILETGGDRSLMTITGAAS